MIFSLSVQAQPKPIKVVIPFGVGGLTDNLNRRFAEGLEQELSRPVVLDPRPGAAGLIGLRHLAQNKSDEVLITVIDATAVANLIHLHKEFTADDFNYLPQLGVTASIALAVKKGSKLKTVEDLRNYRGKPLMVGVNGLGGAHHYYNWLLFNQLPNTPVTLVPYKGVNEMLTNLIGGHIDLGWSNIASVEPQEQAGQIDLVGIIQQHRLETSPHIRTFAEQGITMPANANWFIISNKTTSTDVLDQIDSAVRRLMRSPKFVQLIKSAGLVLEPANIDNAEKSMNQALKQQAKFIEYYKSIKDSK